MNATLKKQKEAGLRGAQWRSGRMPDGVTTSVHPLVTADGASVTGYLFDPGRTNLVCCLMHPREILASHYLVPEILRGGAAVWVQGSRSAGNDLRLEHELAVLDVAAGSVFLRSAGFQRMILVGNSGGASLYAFYNQQSLLDGDSRIARTPGGRPVNLKNADLPVADGLVLVAPHPGQGILLMNSIDPSVSDERDPLSIEEGLFAFSHENGYRPAPEGAKYSAAFVARYREAQRRRVQRIDALAHASIRARMNARRKMLDDERLTQSERLAAGLQEIMPVYRTDADLRCWDTSLDPSDRRVGSLWGNDPFSTNMNGVAFARVCTPESWLSTWSGLSSNASMQKCAPLIEQPTLLVSYTGDACAFPSDCAEIFSNLKSTQKTRVDIRGTHHGLSLSNEERDAQLLCGQAVRTWLKECFDV